MLRKAISTILALTMLVTVLGTLDVTSVMVSAEEEIAVAAGSDALPEDMELITFEDLTTETLPASGGKWHVANSAANPTTNLPEIVTDPEGKKGNVIKLTRDSKGVNHSTLWLTSFENAGNADKIVIEYDAYMANTNATSAIGAFYATPSQYGTGTWGTRIGTTSHANVGGTAAIKYKGVSGWYHVVNEIDLNAGTLTEKITVPEGSDPIADYTATVDIVKGGAEKGRAPAFGAVTSGTIDALKLHQGAENGSAYYDNIQLTYKYVKPEANVKLYANSAEQTDMSAVSNLTDTIEIDFGTSMKESTLSAITVTGPSAPGWSGALDGTKYTLTKPADFGPLAAGTYTITVPTTVESGKGQNPESEHTVTFTVKRDVQPLTKEPAALEDMELITFEEYTTETLPTAGGKWHVVNSAANATSNTPEIVTDPEGKKGNVIKLTRDSKGVNHSTLWLTGFENAGTAEKIVIEYDAYMANTNKTSAISAFYATPSSFGTGTWGTRIGNTSHATVGGTSKSYNGATGWYHIVNEIDLKAETLTERLTVPEGADPIADYKATVEDVKKGSESGRAPAFGAVTTGTIDAFKLHQGAEAGYAYYDNIELRYEYAAPTVTAENVTVIGPGGVEQSVAAGSAPIHTASKTVKIDFGARMDTDTLNDNNVWIEKDSQKLDVIPSYELGGVYSLALAAGTELEANTAYIVHVEGGANGVQNIKGAQLASISTNYVEIPFMTAEASVELSIADVQVNGASVKGNLAAFLFAENAILLVNYYNNTGTPQTPTAIIAYYEGNTMVAANVIEVTVDSTVEHQMQIKKEFAVQAPENVTVDGCKIMLWDSLSGMRPMGANIEL